MLRSGALPVDLVELETRSVGLMLGENALRLGFTAGITGGNRYGVSAFLL